MYFSQQDYALHMARYAHLDVRVSRRSQKYVQSFLSELIHFSPRPPQVYSLVGIYQSFWNPTRNGTFSRIEAAIASTLIHTILPRTFLNQLVYFVSINNVNHSILIIYKSLCVMCHMACSHQNLFADSVRRLNTKQGPDNAYLGTISSAVPLAFNVKDY